MSAVLLAWFPASQKEDFIKDQTFKSLWTHLVHTVTQLWKKLIDFVPLSIQIGLALGNYGD